MLHQRVTVDSLEISYYQAGETGDPVILLHGGGTDSAMLSWREAIPALAKEFRVFAPDWPGYGGSQEMPGPYCLERLVTILHGLMDAWGLERAHLVGLSMGGGAALGYVLAHPDRVSKLVLVDTYGIQKQAPNHRFSYVYLRLPFLVRLTWQSIRKDKGVARAALRSVFANPAGITDALVDEVFEAVQNRSGERSFYAFQRHEMTWKGLRTNYAARLHEIQAPTLFIHGDQDRLVPLEAVRRAARQMPNAQVRVMEDTGHWAPREHPQLFNQWVRDFLKDPPGALPDEVEHEPVGE